MMNTEGVFLLGSLIGLYVLSIKGYSIAEREITIPTNEVIFHLFSRNSATFTLKDVRDKIGLSSYYSLGISRFVIHGWNDSPTGTQIKKLIDTLVSERPKDNIFAVDWSELAKAEYWNAVRNTEIVGADIADFIQILEDETGSSRTRMHLIGHSLGGQVSANVGELLQEPKLGRISGLDTVDFGFDLINMQHNLDPEDADFVDEIHTHVSFRKKGHADFYPNGGLSMPGCSSGLDKFWGLLKGFFSGKTANLLDLFACDHMVVIDYYTETVYSKGKQCDFEAQACSSWKAYQDGCVEGDGKKPDINHMGFYATKPERKDQHFYLRTNAHSPFCRSPESAASQDNSISSLVRLLDKAVNRLF